MPGKYPMMGAMVRKGKSIVVGLVTLAVLGGAWFTSISITAIRRASI